MNKKGNAVLQVEKVIALDNEDSSRGFVRIPRHMIDGNKTDRTRFFRRDLVKIVNRENGRAVYREAVGNNRYELPQAAIALDYDGRDVLGVKLENSVGLEVRRATMLDQYMYFWNHDNPVVRIANRFAVISFVLGVAIGLGLDNLSNLF